jgi:hypothetical protein
VNQTRSVEQPVGHEPGHEWRDGAPGNEREQPERVPPQRRRVGGPRVGDHGEEFSLKCDRHGAEAHIGSNHRCSPLRDERVGESGQAGLRSAPATAGGSGDHEMEARVTHLGTN